MKESNRYFRYFTYIKPITGMPIVKTYGPVIFTLLIMTVFVVFAIKPTIETILVLQKKLADADKIVAQINEKTENLSKGKENYQRLEQNARDKIQRAIPDTIDLKSLIQTLEQSTRTYEASISALQIQPITLAATKDNNIQNKLQEVSFTFNIEASYQTLTAILQDLKANNRLISIDKLTLNRPGEGKSLIMSISGKAYFLR
ncbi:type 4a pilus biogenesis protein PilO [Candidatus Daviesbacteria bacterium]|nr:type 4a pilus biogenesis protein PilO [Candidatus Daviesbacteria bacterium]